MTRAILGAMGEGGSGSSDSPDSDAPGAVDPDAVEPEPIAVDEPTRGWVRRLAFAAPLLVIGLGLAGLVLWNNLHVDPVEYSLDVPNAPQLTAADSNQHVYRIDASKSSVSYDVDEVLAGTAHTAHGTTAGLAGDILIDDNDPTKSQIGEIVINVEQLTSDQSVRDNRIRHDFLESARYPLARVRIATIDGMPAKIDEGKDYPITLKGDLVVKDITKPVTLAATASRSSDTLHVKATTTVKLSDYGIGPISVGPLVTTGNDAKLTIDVTAANAAKGLPYTVAAAPTGTNPPPVAGGPSFATAVQPILEKNCASCHNPGQSGAMIWSLDTAADAASAAKGIAITTQSKYMPPWPASDVGIPLQHDRKLSAEDVKTIADWANTNGAIDVDPKTKIRPAPDDQEKLYDIRHDLELTADQPYQGSVDNTNDYRCFVLDPKFTDTTFITGFQLLPDKVSVVHHALGFRVDGSMRDQLQKLDDASPGTGWSCYAGSTGPGGNQSPDGTTRGSQLIMGWVPGQRPNKLPAGSGIKMNAGDLIVIQMHYHYTHDAPPDLSKMALEVSHDQNLDEVVSQTYLGPAEIPCGANEQGPLCNRDTVLAQLTQEFGPAAPGIANGLMMLCHKNLSDFHTDANGVATSSCDHPVTRTGELIGVLGHEHQIGKTFRLTLNPGTPDEKVLLDIPNWDFNWQMVYSPQESIQLKKGDVIRVECSWDRNYIRSSEPRYVTWAEGTEDEMCYSAVTVREHKG